MSYVTSVLLLVLCLGASSSLGAQDGMAVLYPEGVKSAVTAFKQSFAQDVVGPRLERWKDERHTMSVEMSEMANRAPLFFKTNKKGSRSYYLVEAIEEDGLVRCAEVAMAYREGLVIQGRSDSYDIAEFDPLSLSMFYDYRYYASETAPDYEKLVGFAAMLYEEYGNRAEAELFGNTVLSYYALRDPSLRESVSQVIAELSGWDKDAKLDYVMLGENLRWKLLMPEGDKKLRNAYDDIWQKWCEDEIEIMTRRIEDSIMYKSGEPLGLLKNEIELMLAGLMSEKESTRAPWIAGNDALALDEKKYGKARKERDKKKCFTFWRQEVERRYSEASKIRAEAHKAFDELEAKISGIDYGKPEAWNEVVDLFQKLTGDDENRVGGLDPNVGYDYAFLGRALYYASKPVNEFLGCGYPSVAKEALQAMQVTKNYYPLSRNSIYLKMKIHLMLTEYEEARAELDVIEKNTTDFSDEDRETADKWRVRITQAQLKELSLPGSGPGTPPPSE